MQWHGFEELFSHFCVAGWMFVSCDRFKNDMQARQWLLRLKVPLSILRKEVYEREQNIRRTITFLSQFFLSLLNTKKTVVRLNYPPNYQPRFFQQNPKTVNYKKTSEASSNPQSIWFLKLIALLPYNFQTFWTSNLEWKAALRAQKLSGPSRNGKAFYYTSPG